MVNKPLEKIPLEFILGRETEPGSIRLVKGCHTEQEIKELYRAWLIQSNGDPDSEEHLPYQRCEGTTYRPMLELAFEVEGELIKERERKRTNRYVM